MTARNMTSGSAQLPPRFVARWASCRLSRLLPRRIGSSTAATTTLPPCWNCGPSSQTSRTPRRPNPTQLLPGTEVNQDDGFVQSTVPHSWTPRFQKRDSLPTVRETDSPDGDRTGNGGQYSPGALDVLEDNMSVHESAESTDVLVVGFGPVGKLLAIKLGRAGHRVVVDRQQKGYPLPRAVTHDAEFARILQSIGLPPTSIPEITQPYDEMYVWKNQSGETLIEVDWSGHGSSGWNNTFFFNQPDLEDRLDQIVSELPTVQVRRGWLSTDHVDGPDSVLVTLQDAESQVEKKVRAKYLIGADGATSKVRERMNGGWHDLGYFFDWLVIDVVPNPELKFPHIATQTCDVSRPCTMVPGGP